MYRFLFIAFILVGCEKILFTPNNYNSPEHNFEVCWNEIDLNYAYLSYKKINWDSIYNIYKPKITEESSENYLFSQLSSMLNELNDRHVNIFSDGNISSLGNWTDIYLLNQINNNVLIDSYLSSYIVRNNTIITGKLKSNNIGYIKIYTFSNDKSEYSIIDDIIKDFNDTDGIIIDVRSNGGGNSQNADTIASRFIDQKRLIFKSRYRDGPNHDDFTEWTDFYLEPKSNISYQKPVAILTNRGCASSTEWFVLDMINIPQVTVIGDTTMGIVGNPIFRELPNGWTFRYSNSQKVRPNMEYIENIGIAPDITIHITEPETGVDLILEKAIEVLNN